LGATPTISANWLLQSKVPTQQQLDNFLLGNGYNFSYAPISAGGTISYASGTWAAGILYGSPQVGASYNWTPSWSIFNGSIK